MTIRESLQSAARLFAAGDVRAATAAVSAVLATHPREPNALRLMGVLALQLGQPLSALEYLGKALEADPSNPRSHGTLAGACFAVGRIDEAERHAARSIELQADYADGHVVLGMVHTQQCRLASAVQSLGRAIALRPGDPAAQNLLGNALSTAGRVEEAIGAYRSALDLAPSNAVVHDNLLMALNHHAGDDAERLFAEHRAWAAVHADPLAPESVIFNLDLNPDRPLRIAYVSPDFRHHAVSCFFEPLLAAHDRRQFHVTLYASVQVEDDVSKRLASLGDAWVNVSGLSDEQLCGRIRDDRIDVAIDLAGHTAGNRLRALAGRAAPVQASYLGYPNTTGMRSIDVVITDADLDPPPAQTGRWHAERLVRLPRTIHCYRPPDDAPPVQERPAGAPIRFGSFNRLEKLTARTAELWAGVLAAVPGASMTLKTPALADADARAWVIGLFAARGISAERLALLARDAAPAEHLRRYGEIDVALDSYPYNGTTTTCEALWMGVPVVTLEGPTRVSRTTGGILRTIGLADFCAAEDARFVAVAAALAADEDRRRHLRRDMRARMTGSALGDAATLARALEVALRECWKAFCHQQLGKGPGGAATAPEPGA